MPANYLRSHRKPIEAAQRGVHSIATYLFARCHRSGCLDFLRNNALLLAIQIVRGGGRHGLLFQLLCFGIFAQILMRGGRTCGDRSGRYVIAR